MFDKNQKASTTITLSFAEVGVLQAKYVWIFLQVHYLHFAILLAGQTVIVAVVVALLTSPQTLLVDDVTSNKVYYPCDFLY